MRGLLEGLCDEIEEQGPGVWRLLNSSGPDPDVEAVEPLMKGVGGLIDAYTKDRDLH